MKKLEFQHKINTSRKPIVVDLWAPWCKPCKAMEPVFKEVSAKYSEKVEIVKINADESADVLQFLHVMSIPTVIGFSSGNEIVRRTGYQTNSGLEVIFDAAINGQKPTVMPLAPISRLLRSLAGIAALIIGWYSGKSIALFIIGGVLVFSAFYDRCPIYRAIKTKLSSLFTKTKETPAQ